MKPKTFTSSCYDEILHDIIRGELAPGEKLKLNSLKDKYGLGFSPLREALSRLTDTGLVHVEENKGFRVTPLKEKEVRDIHETFTSIETLALKQAIEKGDSMWEEGVVASLYSLSKIEMQKGPIAYEEWRASNNQFHRALLKGCASERLMHIRDTLHRQFERYVYLSFQLNKLPLVVNHKEHSLIAKATLAKDPQKATKLLWHHLMDSLEEIIVTLKKNKALS